MPFDDALLDSLVAAARDAGQRAHAPYSRFPVGAVLVTTSGDRFIGCNIENISFGGTICAERVAAGSAIADGQRQWRVMAVASRGGVTPCGICRQFLAEFCPELPIVLFDTVTQTRRLVALDKLYPERFERS